MDLHLGPQVDGLGGCPADGHQQPAGTVGAHAFGEAIDAIGIDPGSANFPRVFFYCLLMIIFYAVSSLLSYVLSILMIQLSQKIVFQMRQQVV